METFIKVGSTVMKQIKTLPVSAIYRSIHRAHDMLGLNVQTCDYTNISKNIWRNDAN
jgi:hypothetical protein